MNMITRDHIKPKLLSQSLDQVNPDHYHIVWWLQFLKPVTDDKPLANGWCVFREVEWDY